ncbi:hypothetical protein BHM03_00040712 [Ensete ventricosum]|nr:hypothetical protein BHM03_00040712 [Ensete ventricosum]
MAETVSQLPPSPPPPPPPHSTAEMASEIDLEAQLPFPPPPPTYDDHPASRLEEAVSVVLQLSLSAGMVASGGPTARNHGHEVAFTIYIAWLSSLFMGATSPLGSLSLRALLGDHVSVKPPPLSSLGFWLCRSPPPSWVP